MEWPKINVGLEKGGKFLIGDGILVEARRVSKDAILLRIIAPTSELVNKERVVDGAWRLSSDPQPTTFMVDDNRHVYHFSCSEGERLVFSSGGNIEIEGFGRGEFYDIKIPSADVRLDFPEDVEIHACEVESDGVISKKERLLSQHQSVCPSYGLGDRLPAPLVEVVFRDDNFSLADVEIVLKYLSAIYRESGGNGLKVVRGRSLEPSNAEVVS